MPKKPYILTRPNLMPTARILAERLGISRSVRLREYAPVIRWGNSDHEEYPQDTSYNVPELIYVASNKYRFSQAMTSIEIPHVEVLQGVPGKYPVVIRHNLSGSKGVGIEVVESQDLYSTNHWQRMYWSYWRNFSFELGVHFFDGQVLRVFKKLFNPAEIGEDGLKESKFPIKNACNGYHFSAVKTESYPKLIPLVKEFTDKFGLMFGRLDIGWNSAERKYEIIEVNTAPSLASNENTLELYVERFKTVLGIK